MSTSKLMPGFLKSTLQVASGTLISRVFGLARDICFATLIPKGVTDAFFVAFRIPNLFRRILGEGALTVSFIPVFQSIESIEGHKEAKRYFQVFHGSLIVILLALIALGCLFAPQLIALLTPGWQLDMDKTAQASMLLRWCFPYLFFISLVACYMGILNARHHFWIPSVSPTLLNIVFIISIAVGWTFFHADGHTPWSIFLVTAVILGGLSQWLLNLSAVKRLPMSVTPKLGRHPGIPRTYRLMVPSVIALSALQINIIVTTIFASYLEEGSMSALYYASRLVEFPLGVIAVSISVALLPRIKFDATRSSIYLTRSLFLLLPISVATWVKSDLWVRMIFGYGAFDPHMVDLTSVALKFGALSILGGGVYRIFSAYAFSKEKPWRPAFLSLGGAVLHILFCSLWVKPYGIMGIVLSLGIVSLLQGGFMLINKQTQLEQVPWAELIKLCLASAVLGFGLHIFGIVLDPLHVLLQGLLLIAVGGVFYLFLTELFGSKAWGEWKQALRSRLHRS